MFLPKTSFYKDSRDWRQNFFKTLETRPKEYWDNLKLDIDAHVDKTYILHLPHRTDKVEALKTNLQKIKTKNSAQPTRGRILTQHTGLPPRSMRSSKSIKTAK